MLRLYAWFARGLVLRADVKEKHVQAIFLSSRPPGPTKGDSDICMTGQNDAGVRSAAVSAHHDPLEQVATA